MTHKGPTTARAAVFAAGVALGGVIVGLVLWKRPSAPEPMPPIFRSQAMSTIDRGDDPSTPGAMSPETFFEIERAVTEAIDAGSDDAVASRAAPIAAQYLAYIADNDIDRAAALGLPVAATINPEALGPTRQQLEIVPERMKPRGWQSFNDLQALRWGASISMLARWQQVALDTIETVHSPAGTPHPEIRAFFVMNPLPGYEVSAAGNALFMIEGLNPRVHSGEVASLLIRMAVQIERGDWQRVSLLLGEHSPGQWYPVAHRVDIIKEVSLFPNTRKARPM